MWLIEQTYIKLREESKNHKNVFTYYMNGLQGAKPVLSVLFLFFNYLLHNGVKVFMRLHFDYWFVKILISVNFLYLELNDNNPSSNF